MAYYSVLNVTDTTDLASLMTAANRISDNLFMPIILLVIWSVWTLGSIFIGKSFFRSTLFASFLCSILSILFVLLNWLSPNYMYFLFLLTALSLLGVKLSEAYS